MPNSVNENATSANNSNTASTSVQRNSTTAIGNVNAVDILIIQNDTERRVPIRPICEALGVDFSGQLQKLKEDPIFGSTMETISTVGKDGKQREMQTLPHKFIFGWIFRIDSRNVKPESREALIKYQLECNEALYSYFELRHRYIEERQELIEELREIIEALSQTLLINKEQLSSAKSRLKNIREMDFDSWRESQRQLTINFNQEG